MKVPVLLEKETAFAKLIAKEKVTKIKELKWGKQCEACTKKAEWRECNKAKLFATTCGHCDELMKNTLGAKQEHRC